MLNVQRAADDQYAAGGKILPVLAGKMYSVVADIIGYAGGPYCSFFGITFFGKDNQFLGRRIRWLNDFTGKTKTYSLLFRIPEDCVAVRVIYRMNNETPNKASCKYGIIPPSQIMPKEISSPLEESYDISYNFLPSNQILSVEQEAILEKNLVWIFALPRSGTTWLGTQLLSYNSHAMPEPLIGKHLGKLEGDPDRIIRTITRWSASKEDYFFNPKHSNTLKMHLRKLILNRIHAQFQDLNRKIIICESDGSMAADILSQCFPNSKIIFLLRDGRDVINNIVDINRPLSKKARKKYSENNLLPNLLIQSKLWTATTEIILQTYERRPKEQSMLVKYEDLRSNTFEVLKQIYKFIGTQISDDKLNEIVRQYEDEIFPERTKKITTWRNNFAENEILAMENIMGSMLNKLNYETRSIASMDNAQSQFSQQFFNLASNENTKSHDLNSNRQDTLEKNLVWIFALPRSGTTWLGTQLLSYNSHAMPEPLIGNHLGNWLFAGISPQDNSRLVDIFVDKVDYFFNRRNEYVWRYYLRQLILNRIYAQFQDVSKKVIIKEPNGSMAADILSQCFPNSKIIFLLRDGRDVVDSKVDSLREGSWQAQVQGTSISSTAQEQRLKTITGNAKQWTATTEIILQTYERRPKEQSMLVKYEDLRSNTFEVLKQIYKFIGTQISDDKLNEIVKRWAFENLPESIKGPGKFFRAATPGKWKEDFSDSEKEAIMEIMENMLVKLGYTS